VSRRAAAAPVPVVGLAGGLFKLLPRVERDDAVVGPLEVVPILLVAEEAGTARFGRLAVELAGPVVRFVGGAFSNLLTAAAMEELAALGVDFATVGEAAGAAGASSDLDAAGGVAAGDSDGAVSAMMYIR
jgi:hypothetical protein